MSTLRLIVGLFGILSGIFLIFDGYKKKNDMPEKVFGLKEGDFSVRDKENFNKIMTKKYIGIGTFLLVSGFIVMINSESTWLYMFPMVMNILADNNAKKYLVIYNS